MQACGARKAHDPGPRGTLRFKGTPKGAVVEVDEIRLGPLEMFVEQGLLLRPGTHRVVVSHEGYFTEYKLVKIEKDQLEILEVELRPLPH